MDARDWPTVDGCFVPAALSLDEASPLVRRARAGAVRLAAALGTDALCIYTFGSILDPTGEPPGDIDLLVVTPDGVADRPVHERAEALLADMADEEGCPSAWDVTVRPRRAFGMSAFLALLASTRAALLVGPPLWTRPPRIPANAETARALWPEKRRELGIMIREVHTFLNDESLSAYQASVVRRVQKRVLRLGMLDSLAQDGVFATDIERSAELAAHAHPALAEDIRTVAHDFCTHEATLESLERAIALCAELVRQSPLAAARAP